MQTELENYLAAIDRKLRPLPASERVDIVREIKSSMVELENDGFSAAQILDRLGSPREWARNYLGEALVQRRVFGWKRFLTACAFYSVVGLSGLIVVPCLAIMIPAFLICGAALPLFAVVKLLNIAFELGIPYINDIGVVFNGVLVFSPTAEFFVSLAAGALVFLMGLGCRKLLTVYIRKVSSVKHGLTAGEV